MYIIIKKPIYMIGLRGNIDRLGDYMKIENRFNKKMTILEISDAFVDIIIKDKDIPDVQDNENKEVIAKVIYNLDDDKINTDAITRIQPRIDRYSNTGWLFNNLKKLYQAGVVEFVKEIDDSVLAHYHEMNNKHDELYHVKDMLTEFYTRAEISYYNTTRYYKGLYITHHSNSKINLPALSNTHDSITNRACLNSMLITDDYVIGDMRKLELANTSISCGVTQLFYIDEYLYSMRTAKENNVSVEVLDTYASRIMTCLEQVSPGKTLILSTQKRTMKHYKQEFAALMGNYNHVTRYAKNPNSGYKIGTTILILKE